MDTAQVEVSILKNKQMKTTSKRALNVLRYSICGLLLLCSINSVQAQDSSNRYEVRPGEKIATDLQTLEIIYLQESTVALDDKLILNLYPNPVNTVLNISIGTNGVIKEVHFFNMAGIKIAVPQLQENNNSAIYNVANLATGIYILSIELENGTLLNKKIIKN